jgi:hypothetical protein
MSIPGNVMAPTPGVRYGQVSDRDLASSVSFCLCSANYQRTNLFLRASRPPRASSAVRTYNVVRLRADVMCSLCHSVAMPLSTLKFRQSINALIRCAS